MYKLLKFLNELLSKSNPLARERRDAVLTLACFSSLIKVLPPAHSYMDMMIHALFFISVPQQ